MAPNTNDIIDTGRDYGAFELDSDSNDTALLLFLPAGAYTVRLTDSSGQGGIALAESSASTNVGF